MFAFGFSVKDKFNREPFRRENLSVIVAGGVLDGWVEFGIFLQRLGAVVQCMWRDGTLLTRKRIVKHQPKLNHQCPTFGWAVEQVQKLERRIQQP